jgi:hypothetical protein
MARSSLLVLQDNRKMTNLVNAFYAIIIFFLLQIYAPKEMLTNIWPQLPLIRGWIQSVLRPSCQTAMHTPGSLRR